MVRWGVRLANHLTTAVFTFLTKPRAFLPLQAAEGICLGLSDFHEVKLLTAGSSKISRKNMSLETEQEYRGLPYVQLRQEAPFSVGM